jgi:Mg-chelatase subunit ChlD
MSSRHQFLFVATLCILSLFFPLIVSAQNPGQSKIHIHETSEPQQVTTVSGSLGLLLQTSFSVLDAEDQVLMAFEIESATFELEGNSYPAVVQEVDVPWTIVLLIDASKTMGGYTASSTFKAVKTAIATMVTGIPQNADIALLKFDNDAPTVVDFTEDKEAIADALKYLPAVSYGDSCLNNSLYEAVNKLSGAPGRRAVIVITASADDCYERSTPEVLDLARANQVQIYPVGLQGYTITQEELDAIAGPSGGLAELRDEGTLGFGLSNISALLVNQWTARATIYPSAGQKTANLLLNLSDDTILTSPSISFTSAQDYIPPTEIHLKGKVQSVGEGILFNLDIVQQDLIRQLNVNIISMDTGQSVLSQALVSFSDVNTVPTVSLLPGFEYTLIVTAMDSGGQVLSEDSAEFTYEPPQATLSVTDVQTPSEDQEHFLISVSTQNLGGAVKFKAWLADIESGVQVSGTQTTVPLGEPIMIPIDDLETGDYAIVVQALDSTDTVLSESSPYTTTYTRPGLFARFRSWVSGSPLAIAVLSGLCCLTLAGMIGLVWFILPKRGKRQESVELVMPQKARRSAPVAQPATPPPPQQVSKQPAPARPDPSPEIEAPISPPKASAPAGPELNRREAVAQIHAARINLLTPTVPEFSQEIRHSPFTIGRQMENDAVLPVDSASGVSKYHLTIIYEDSQYFARDDKSSFGTAIDGEPLVKGQPSLLRDGAVISLGPQVLIKFQLISKGKPAPNEHG